MFEWQPIDTCPDEVCQALVFWPAFKLDPDGIMSMERHVFADGSSGLIGRAVRECRGSPYWEGGEFELDANGAEFDDDYTFAGQPTHWMRLPPEPREAVGDPREAREVERHQEADEQP